MTIVDPATITTWVLHRASRRTDFSPKLSYPESFLVQLMLPSTNDWRNSSSRMFDTFHGLHCVLATPAAFFTLPLPTNLQPQINPIPLDSRPTNIPKCASHAANPHSLKHAVCVMEVELQTVSQCLSVCLSVCVSVCLCGCMCVRMCVYVRTSYCVVISTQKLIHFSSLCQCVCVASAM